MEADKQTWSVIYGIQKEKIRLIKTLTKCSKNEEDFPKSKIRIHHFIGFRCEWTLWRINLEIVDKADPEDEGGNTPLHFAARNGHFEVCQLIVNNITKKNPKNFIEETPIQLASDAGHSTIVMMIQASLGKKFKLGWLDYQIFQRQTFIYRLTITVSRMLQRHSFLNLQSWSMVYGWQQKSFQ